MERQILHVDVNNAFLSWLAVYKLKNGEKIDIRDQVAVIGGDETKRSGIVLAKSYKAKQFGIVTGETLYSARQKCRNLQVYQGNYKVYKEYSNKLTIEIGKKYNERNLRYMRKFYELFVNQNWNTMCSNLTWSHYREVLSLGNFNEIKYYLEECENKNLSVRELHFKIKTKEYERLSKKVKQNLEKTKKLKIDDLIPNPIIIKSNTFKDELSEYALKEVILNDLDSFLKELGTGFSYVGNEYKIKIGDRYNYIDLLLFNYTYNC